MAGDAIRCVARTGGRDAEETEERVGREGEEGVAAVGNGEEQSLVVVGG